MDGAEIDAGKTYILGNILIQALTHVMHNSHVFLLQHGCNPEEANFLLGNVRFSHYASV